MREMNRNKKKLTVGLLFGGSSPEHAISIISGHSIYQNIDQELFECLPISINKKGQWFLSTDPFQNFSDDPQKVSLGSPFGSVVVQPGHGCTALLDLKNSTTINIDVFFPITHGLGGEDGNLQGLLQSLRVPFVGCKTLSSAISMDKDIAKRLLTQKKIPNSRFVTFQKIPQEKDLNIFLVSHGGWNPKKPEISWNIKTNEICNVSQNSKDLYKSITDQLGQTLFIKPCNNGSSVGVHKVQSEAEFKTALLDAFQHDEKVIIEEFILGRELECAVLQKSSSFSEEKLEEFQKNKNLKNTAGMNGYLASDVGEIIAQKDFYSYEAKYVDKKGAVLKTPADITDAIRKQIQDLSIQTCQALEVSGMARCDVFLQEDGNLFVNEINTIPGFTSISQYPSLWNVSGLNFKDLITELIHEALV